MERSYTRQHSWSVRCEWGAQGIAALGADSEVIIIVDVLSFSTSVDVAVANGAVVYPYGWHDESAEHFAEAHQALLVHSRHRNTSSYSLSPVSLQTVPPGTRLVIPSPNGSSLSIATGTVPTLAGCFRNARAVAHAAQTIGERISIIPAGERWADGSLRPAIEDWLGTGAIIAHLDGSCSPEADLARRAFLDARSELERYVGESASGNELRERGFADDIQIATALNVSECVPVKRDGAYQQHAV